MKDTVLTAIDIFINVRENSRRGKLKQSHMQYYEHDTEYDDKLKEKKRKNSYNKDHGWFATSRARIL